MRHKGKTESGNIVFIILAAVVLFAALGFAVSSGRNSSQSNMTREKARLGASEIEASFVRLDASIKSLKMVSGCADNQIAFDNTKSKLADNSNANPPGANAFAPETRSCHVYDTAGARMNVWMPAADLLDLAPTGGAWEPGNPIALDIAIAGQGEAGVDELVYVVPFVDPEVCKAYNSLRGVDNPGGNPPTAETDNETDSFDGVYDTGATETAVSSKSFCAARDGDIHDSHIYHVIISR